MSFLIALEGIDGSGKGTQAALLHERLQAAGRSAALISFPRYEHTLFGKAIGEYLNGRFGALDEVDPFLVSLLYAGDRFEWRSHLAAALDEHEVVVLDRYVASNIAHQGAKADGEAREELIERIVHIEHELYELPRANLTLLLDLPAELAQQLIAKKAARSYTKKKADLQEADAVYLQRVREVYLDVAARESGWRTIACSTAGGIRAIDDVAGEIWAVVDEGISA